MTGAILNAAGILLGGLIGLAQRRGGAMSPQSEAFLKLGLGLGTIFFGLRLVWISFNGPALSILKQVVIAALAIIIGKWLGRLMRLQKASNHLGSHARKLIERNRPDDPQRFASGFNVCAILFCAAPLGILGSIHDGLATGPGGTSYFYILAVKAVMDGLAMMGFVRMFGWGTMLSALPVFVFQFAIILFCHLHAEPFLREHSLLDSVNGVGGLVVCTVGLVIFEVKRVELADYLPALAVAPLLTWVWR
ncbi:MAG TPA: DUF554 family protein [Verrucomicrobiota bacterium]|nr:DUF554 family protein [Verrucomicrobiota bacterium]